MSKPAPIVLLPWFMLVSLLGEVLIDLLMMSLLSLEIDSILDDS
jgi:hypothetical protein